MNKPKRIAIIGAGGIACSLVPIISRMADILLVDGDVYEPSNSTRQFPALKSTGNKAQILSELVQPNTLHTIDYIPLYLEGPRITQEEAWGEVDMIIGCVDNNKSRLLIAEIADGLNIPAILAGNEHQHGEAMLLLPGLHDPTEYHWGELSDPAPFDCNSDKTLEENPQTAIANIMAAAAVMHLYLSLTSVEDPLNALVYSRLDTHYSKSRHIRDYADIDPLPVPAYKRLAQAH